MTNFNSKIKIGLNVSISVGLSESTISFYKPNARLTVRPFLTVKLKLVITLVMTNQLVYLLWVETNPSNIRIFPMDICFLLPHGTTLKALIRMLIQMFTDVT
jgi:hypothetical protein